MEGLGGATASDPWFRLGDRDLATHLWRTDRLRAGARPTDVARELRGRPRHRADDPADDRRAGPDRGPDRRRLARVPGVLRPPPPGARGPRGPLPRHRGRPADARGPRGARAGRRHRHRAVEPDRVDRADPRRARDARRPSAAARDARASPVVAVSGIIGGKALKGPADRMLGVARPRVERRSGSPRLYRDLATRFRHRRQSTPTLARGDRGAGPRDRT